MSSASKINKILEASSLLKIISNKNRLAILCNLKEGSKTVGELQNIVGLSQSAISQHLALLRDKQIVVGERSAQTIYYSLKSDSVKAIIKLLHQLYCHSK